MATTKTVAGLPVPRATAVLAALDAYARKRGIESTLPNLPLILDDLTADLAAFDAVLERDE